jgi:hypothetical protein
MVGAYQAPQAQVTGSVKDIVCQQEDLSSQMTDCNPE